MSERLDGRGEGVLRRILLGELDPTSSEAQGLVEQDAELRDAIEEWRKLEEQLDRVRAMDDELVAATSADASAEDRALVSDLVERSLKRRRPRILRWVIAAAALVVASLFVIELTQESPDPAPTTTLGPDKCIHPRDEVDAYSPFVVDEKLEARWSLRIVVETPEGVELLDSGRIESNRWELTAGEQAVLTNVPRIRWRYELVDPHGDSVEFGAADAIRRR